MVFTRKRVAAPSSSSNPGTIDSTPQSNLNLLASSASCEAVHPSTESLVPDVVAPALASDNRCGLQESPGGRQADASKHTLQPGSMPHLVSSFSIAVSEAPAGGVPLSPTDPKTVSHPQFSVLPQSAAVVSCSTGTAEGEVPFSGSFSASQVQVSQGAAAAASGSTGAEQPAVVRYKIVYQTPQSGPGAAYPTGKQSGASSAINVGLTSLFPSRPPGFSARPPIPTAYTILAAPNKGGSTPRHVLVPVSRALSIPSPLATSLLTSGSVVRAPKPAAAGSASGCLLTGPVPSLAITSPPITITSPLIPMPVACSAAMLKLSPMTASTPVLLPAAPVVLSASAPQPMMASSVSRALFKLANSAKAAMVTNVNVVSTTTSTTFSGLPAMASSASPVDVSPSIAAPAQDPTQGSLTPTEEGEMTMTWDKESTLKLIRLYKEHQAYLNDHHYKKKSVRRSVHRQGWGWRGSVVKMLDLGPRGCGFESWFGHQPSLPPLPPLPSLSLFSLRGVGPVSGCSDEMKS